MSCKKCNENSENMLFCMNCGELLRDLTGEVNEKAVDNYIEFMNGFLKTYCEMVDNLEVIKQDLSLEIITADDATFHSGEMLDRLNEIFEDAFLKLQDLMYDLLNSDIEDTRFLKLSVKTMISSLSALKAYDELKDNLDRLTSFYRFCLREFE